MRRFEARPATAARAPPSAPPSRTPAASSAIFDADLEYDPDDLANLLPPLVSGDTNAVFGVRAFDGYTSHSFLFVLGNKGVTLVANVLFNVYLRDLMTCHKAIRTDVFKALPLQAAGLRDRAGDRRQAAAARRAHLRGPRPLQGARQRRGQEADRRSTGCGWSATLVRCRLHAG